MKIAVIGYSGSGKSTLAEKLGRKHGVDPLYLDTVYWLPGWEQRSREEMRAMVSDYLDTHDSWVIDGNYSKICYDRRMDEADQIVLMQFSPLDCLFRVWQRYQQSDGKSRASMTEGCPEKLDREFIRWVLIDGRKKEHRERLKQVQSRYRGKVFVIRNQRELNEFERVCGLCSK